MLQNEGTRPANKPPAHHRKRKHADTLPVRETNQTIAPLALPSTMPGRWGMKQDPSLPVSFLA
jgi:hypothetical protein